MNKLEIGLVFLFLTVACELYPGYSMHILLPGATLSLHYHGTFHVLTCEPLLDTVGLIILWFFNRRNAKQRAADPNSEDAQYEGRLSSLCWTAWCLACGLAIFAATANPAYGHYAWIGTGIGVFFIGIANYVIYASTIDYMVAAYGFYAASATGGNGFARDFLAGVLTPVGKLWIEDMGPQAMCGILAGFSFLFFLACILVRLKGPLLRRRSKYTVKEANPNARQVEHSRHNSHSGHHAVTA